MITRKIRWKQITEAIVLYLLTMWLLSMYLFGDHGLIKRVVDNRTKQEFNQADQIRQTKEEARMALETMREFVVRTNTHKDDYDRNAKMFCDMDKSFCSFVGGADPPKSGKKP